ncbi:thioesterase family protein [Streptomyces shenzhenensis]|uniref:thioesterase family protein n=1 Tax=Streptomyces shenzhenensis TaxID=943815 RepID=UPI003F53E581
MTEEYGGARLSPPVGPALLGDARRPQPRSPHSTGSTVTIEAVLTAVEGRRLLFDVTARDEAAIVCRGRHRRAVVDLDRCESTITARTACPVEA